LSSFAPDWLALREPYDRAARSAALADRFAAAVGATPHLIDLGCGTGANLRYLAPRIAGAQRWRCIDHDAALLESARAALQDWGDHEGWPGRSGGNDLAIARPGGAIAVSFALGDLARDGLPDDGDATGLSASALLDLTSADWLHALADRYFRMPLLMALSFDGRLAFEPAAPGDVELRARFIAHQRSDKGFGRALGPDAAPYLADLLVARGCKVALEQTDWHLGPDDGPLLRATIEGIVGAAREVAQDSCLEHWASLRHQQMAADDLRLTVGHLDLLALPG
jgi:SAM-dependent methyltransferase